MSEQHYIVTLKKGANKDEIFDEMSRDTSADSSVDSNIIPDRKVDTVDARSSSKRVFEMALTDEEANKLRNDSRVGDLMLDFKWDDDWLDFERPHNPTGWGQSTAFGWEPDSTSSFRNNWGLIRHIEATNGWGTNRNAQRTSPSTGGQAYYTGHLNGTGVDYVHQEGGTPRPTHEYLDDANGTSRLQQFQWNTLPNCSGAGTMSYSGSGDSHATHCCGTAIGRHIGWGTNATVYVLDTGNISRAYWFDAIKEFHKAKSVDPTTGVKRPTVVSASWGYKSYFANITATYFRGSDVSHTTDGTSRQYGKIGDGANRFNTAVYNLSAEVEEMQDEGVIYCKSAGNQYQKICYSGDVDYDNYITRSVGWGGITAGQPHYYNRGAGNIGPDTIVVGNLAAQLATWSSNPADEQCLSSSDKGPRVDLYVAGNNIVSGGTSSDTNYYSTSGTSMSTPQVAGMCTLLLQANPGMTPAQVRTWFMNNAQLPAFHHGSTLEGTPSTFFQSDRGLMNGTGRVAYFPFSAHTPLTSTVSGNITF
tara:strand:+ start:3836 stop:5431 length:1596 start_codon:yes stop_codon:yes gene_type:complete